MAEDRKSMPKIHRGVLSEAMASANRCRGIVRTSNFLRLDMLCILGLLDSISSIYTSELTARDCLDE